MKKQTHLSPPHEWEDLPNHRPQFGLLVLLLFVAALAPLFTCFASLYREGFFDWVPLSIVGALGAALGLLHQRRGNKLYGCLVGALLCAYATAALLTAVSLPDLLLRDGLAK